MLARLSNKHILLGVTGGIAAYKSAELIRRLRDAGAEVQVVMTAAAREFITPLTLQALSGNPVHVDLLDPAAEAAMGHIELARWADLFLVAPASAERPVMVPALWAFSGCSIFIASRTTMASPSATVAPSSMAIS